MSTVLIVGGTRGLGASLVRLYSARADDDSVVFGTTRSNIIPAGFPVPVKWLPGIDLMLPSAADSLARQLRDPHESASLSTVIITAGHFTREDLTTKGPDWEEEQRMYTTSAIAPVFVVHRLYRAGLLRKGARVVLVSSESGSIALRHEHEGGGNYAHHASKAALNMVGRLLSLDLAAQDIVVSIVHPGFMRTEMTAGVGFDKYWDDGGGESVQGCPSMPAVADDGPFAGSPT
ncbi:oxidoreductase, short chain dehydrogenase/reductase family superfamily [Drechmeria coniospora]|uniref:Oxidoreductase, short chain dehydrogenase/reductase family superfamily n=1 Tax=Drechmeria coniospora TaxID=98403 RepID=A0A151GU67_DRECN|nr:oxidoreductase, short chain dehydrogenase/reductase family superfamily [Drechmeria coniospora]KYK60666.1 oxidoreductase, short chain dehydrogenase/reductase family superfamily [Drechmeria coniospora]